MMYGREQYYGLQGERYALLQLLDRGYDARLVSDFFSDVDIIVDGLLRVEVKTAAAHWHKAKAGVWRARWQFNLTRLSREGDYVVICLCEVPNGRDRFNAFVIPSALLLPMGRRHLQITSNPAAFKGWASTYREQWQVIEQMLQRVRHHAGQLALPLFQTGN